MSDALKKEIIGIALLGLFLFIFVSLLSYHPFDPSPNSLAASGTVKNFCGKAGSYGADFLVQHFGYMSYALCGFILFFSVLSLRKKAVDHLLLLAAGFVLLFFSLSALLQILVGRMPMKGVTIEVSGLVGFLVAGGLINVFASFGSLLLSVVLFLISLFLIVQAPLFSIAGAIAGARLSKRRAAQVPKPVKIVEERGEEKEKERKEKKVVQESFDFLKEIGPYKLPPVSLLDPVEKKEVKVDKESAQANARILEKKLKDYGIDGKVVEVRPGPVITMYEFEPGSGVKVSRIANLSDDLAMALSAVSIRIIAPIPGKAVVGIEIPNKIRQTVYLREIIESSAFADSKTLLTLSLGKTIAGSPSWPTWPRCRTFWSPAPPARERASPSTP